MNTKYSSKAVCYAGLFVLGCEQRFLLFQVRFCPVKRENRAGSPRNESGYSRRGMYPHQFPASGG